MISQFSIFSIWDVAESSIPWAIPIPFTKSTTRDISISFKSRLSNYKTRRTHPQGKHYISLHGVVWRAICNWAISQLTRGTYSRWRSRLVDRLMVAVETHRTGCPRCGSDAIEIRASKPGSPHAAGEYCGGCGRWRRWISKREAASLRGNGGASC
jgi:hypothetical protein